MVAGVYVDDGGKTARSVRVIWTWAEGMEHGSDINFYDIEAESNFHPGVWTVVAIGRYLFILHPS